ncbi:hypothetical protein FACS1894208_05180 [Clostridia bacterium]|nr:hypothetical protein FACS1894208_05180 [Clostridia bacterium]
MSSIITIWGKSGAGKTTAALNLAAALSQSRCVGLISSNLQYGLLTDGDKGLLNALEEPSRTKECFVKSSFAENLFLLSVPVGYSGLLADNVSNEDAEQVLDSALSYFEVLIADGSEDITNPVSSVALSQSGKIIAVHKPSVAAGVWYRSMSDFISQLHLENKLLHVIQQAPWHIEATEYASALRINVSLSLPYVPNAPQLEDNAKPIILESEKYCRRYGKAIIELSKIVSDSEVVL